MEIYKIYGLINKNVPNDIKYIGYTRLSIEKRLHAHKTITLHGKYKNAYWIKKYKNDVDIILLEDNILSLDEACEKEIFYIELYNHLGFNLNNTTKGGEGMRPTEETRIKMSKAQLGNKKCLGHKHSEETLKIMSEVQSGHIVSMETRNKISNSHKGKKLSNNTKNKIKETISANPPFLGRTHTLESITSNIVNQPNRISVEIDGITYKSIREASASLKMNKETISNRCKSNNYPNYIFISE